MVFNVSMRNQQVSKGTGKNPVFEKKKFKNPTGALSFICLQRRYFYQENFTAQVYYLDVIFTKKILG